MQSNGNLQNGNVLARLITNESILLGMGDTAGLKHTTILGHAEWYGLVNGGRFQLLEFNQLENKSCRQESV